MRWLMLLAVLLFVGCKAAQTNVIVRAEYEGVAVEAVCSAPPRPESISAAVGRCLFHATHDRPANALGQPA